MTSPPLTDARVLEIARKHFRYGVMHTSSVTILTADEVLAFARALLAEHEASRICPNVERRVMALAREVEIAP